MTNEQQTIKERHQFANELPLVMHRAGQLGLWRTMHKLHDAVRELGWELADISAGKQP